jgi:hypothetical protein
MMRSAADGTTSWDIAAVGREATRVPGVLASTTLPDWPAVWLVVIVVVVVVLLLLLLLLSSSSSSSSSRTYILMLRWLDRLMSAGTAAAELVAAIRVRGDGSATGERCQRPWPAACLCRQPPLSHLRLPHAPPRELQHNGPNVQQGLRLTVCSFAKLVRRVTTDRAYDCADNAQRRVCKHRGFAELAHGGRPEPHLHHRHAAAARAC